MDVEEFAELIVLDGVIIKASINNNTENISNVASRNYAGLHGDFSRIFFLTEDYCRKRLRIPKQGDYVFLEKGNDRRQYTVVSSENDLQVTELVLQSYRQNTLRGVPIDQY